MAEIVICAEQSVTRVGLAAMVTMADIEVVGQVDGLSSLSRWLQTGRADLVVVELSSLGSGEVEGLLESVEALPEEERFFILALVDVEGNVPRRLLVQLMEAGIVSLVPIDVSTDGLRSAIAAMLSGFIVLHPDVTEVLFAGMEELLLPASVPELESDLEASLEPDLEADLDLEIEPLTPREIQVLNQLANGLTNRVIAQALTISEHTVKFHISAILSKLNATSRTEAVTIGIRAGLVML